MKSGGGDPREAPKSARVLMEVEHATRRLRRRCATTLAARMHRRMYIHREGLADTPKRVAKAMAFAVRGYGMSATHHVESALFSQGHSNIRRGGDSEALADDVPGAVLPPDRPIRPPSRARAPSSSATSRSSPPTRTTSSVLRKMPHRLRASRRRHRRPQQVARVAEVFARRAQTPDRLAADIADAIARGAAPRGVRVLLEGQMGPHEPAPSAAKRTSGCFQSTHPRGAIPRGIRRHARGGGGRGGSDADAGPRCRMRGSSGSRTPSARGAARARRA